MKFYTSLGKWVLLYIFLNPEFGDMYNGNALNDRQNTTVVSMGLISFH